VQPIIDRATNTFRFDVRTGMPRDGFDPNKGTVLRTGATCLLTDVEITLEIQADLPDGAGDKLVRDVTENCRTLKFTTFGFEESYMGQA